MSRQLLISWLAGAIAAIASYWATAPEADAAQSFDCAQASRQAQVAICESPALLALDKELNEVVKQLRAKAGSGKKAQNTITNRQIRWIGRLNGRCRASITCLTAAYQEGINRMRQEVGLPPREWVPETVEAVPLQPDCGQTTRQAQVAICESPALLALDKEFNEVVKQLRAKVGSGKKAQNSITNRQIRWTGGLNGRCGAGITCLTTAYQEGINSLRQEVGLPPREWAPETVEAAPPQPGPAKIVEPSRTESQPYSLTGIWEGSYNCDTQRHLATMTVTSSAEQGELIFEFYPERGTDGRTGSLSYSFEVDPLLGEVNLRPIRALDKLSGFMSPDGNSITGTVQQARECGAFEFHKVAEATQKQAARTPLLAGPVEAPRVTALQAKTYQEFCTALIAWGNQYMEAFPEVQTSEAFSHADLVQKLNLFRDEKFAPFFGVSLTKITAAQWKIIIAGWRSVPAISGTGKLDCQTPGPGSEFVRSYWSHLLLGGGRSLRREIEVMRRALQDRDRLIAAVEALPDQRQSVERLDALLQESEERLKVLWPSDRASFNELVERKRAGLADGTLIAMLDRADESAASLSYIADLHYLAAKAGAERAAQAKAVIERRLKSYADERLVGIVQDTVDLKEFAAIAKTREQLRVDFQPFTAYASAKAAAADVDGRFGRSVNLIEEKLEKQLPPDADVSAFSVQREALWELHPNSHDHVDFLPLWDMYYRQADLWVIAQVESFEAAAKAPEQQPGFDASNPLGTPAGSAFDANNPLGEDFGGGEAVPAASDDNFLSQPWSYPEIIGPTYLNDRDGMYSVDQQRVLYYFAKLGGKIGPYCPAAAATEDLARMLIRDQMGPDPFGAGREEAVKKAIMDVLGTAEMAINNPGQVLENALQAEGLERKLDADAQIITMKIGCEDGRVAKLFENAISFLRNPTAGVDPAKLDLQGICVINEGKISSPEEAFELCGCATNVLLGQLSQRERRFIQQKPDENWGTFLAMYPKHNAKLRQECVFKDLK